MNSSAMNETSMIFSAGKDYRNSTKIHLPPDEIEAIGLKQHPMQIWLLSEHPEFTRDDCFGLPIPYIRAINEAFISFEKGEGKYGKGYATASYTIRQEDPWFVCHFLGDPVMPGSQGQDVIFQLAGLWSTIRCNIVGRPRALAGQFNFFGQILPSNSKVFYRIDIQRFLKKKRILFFSGSIAVDDESNTIYHFENCKMGFYLKEELNIHQKSTAYYQPDWQKIEAEQKQYIQQSKAFYDNY
ncbi:MAG: hypothetical protein AAFZ15_12000 [Bacteroidota bacterium]